MTSAGMPTYTAIAGNADSTKINITWPVAEPGERDQRQGQQHQQAALGNPPRAVAQGDRGQKQRRRQPADLADGVQDAQHLRSPRRPASAAQQRPPTRPPSRG